MNAEAVSMYFASIDLFTLLTCVSLLLVVILGFRVLSINRRLNRFMEGKNAVSLEKTYAELLNSTRDFNQFRQELEQYLVRAEERMRRSIQGVSVVRFNALQGTGDGGRQSFSAAFLDEEGTGIVLSSIYARDRFALFGKPVAKGNSEFELTEEEERAIRSARERISHLHTTK